jgi:hypothetical protein
MISCFAFSHAFESTGVDGRSTHVGRSGGEFPEKAAPALRMERASAQRAFGDISQRLWAGAEGPPLGRAGPPSPPPTRVMASPV